MLHVILQSALFFLPAYLGNAAPVIADRFRLFERLKVPVDGGLAFYGQPLFGRTKTWRGLILGALMGAVTGVLEGYLLHDFFSGYAPIYSFSGVFGAFMGLLLGLGESLGDLAKSFVKRRLAIKSSAPFFPFDQMSFIGALLLGAIIFVPPLEHIVTISVMSLLIPVAANYAAYKIGWKKVPW